MRRSLIFAAVAASLLSCKRTETHEHGVTQPTQLCREGTPLRSCRSAEDVEALLTRGDLEILAATETTTGVQRARVLTLRSGGRNPVVFRAKWRAHTTTTRRNSPRFELAAYAVQKLFLSPGEYVVPPTAAHCFPIEAYRARVDRAARPTFAGSKCVYGILSYWLEDVTSIADAQRAGWFHGLHDHAFDPDLFERDHVYRDSIARVNLLTYVIGHRDSHVRNFVIARTDSKPAHHSVYSVDNSLSFTMSKNPGLRPRHDWSVIRVPALPRTAVDRLRSAYARVSSLAAVAVLRRDNDGHLVPTAVGSLSTTTGVDWTDDRLIVGLTAAELDGTRERIAALLAREARGELPVY